VNLRVRAFDDGVGFQVAFGESFGSFVVTSENTEFDFLADVPAADWDETVVVDAAVGDYVVTARRQGETWYVGAMTDESARDVGVSLDFLADQSDGWYVREYTDAPGTDYGTDPTDVAVYEYTVGGGDNQHWRFERL